MAGVRTPVRARARNLPGQKGKVAQQKTVSDFRGGSEINESRGETGRILRSFFSFPAPTVRRDIMKFRELLPPLTTMTLQRFSVSMYFLGRAISRGVICTSSERSKAKENICPVNRVIIASNAFVETIR